MSFIQTVLLLLGTLLLIAFTVVVLVVYFGRKLYFSWTKPYKEHDSLEKLSNKSLPFLQEFTQHPLFYRWIRTEGKRATYIKHSFLCIEPTYERASILNVTERKTEKVRNGKKTKNLQMKILM